MHNEFTKPGGGYVTYKLEKTVDQQTGKTTMNWVTKIINTDRYLFTRE